MHTHTHIRIHAHTHTYTRIRESTQAHTPISTLKQKRPEKPLKFNSGSIQTP